MKKTMVFLAVLSVAVLGTASADLRDGLAGYWPLDGDYMDVTGRGHDGAASGGLQFVEGVLGQAVDCPGSGGINTGSWNPSETSGRLSISCWAQWRPGTADSWQGLVAKRTDWADGQTYWFIECSTANNSLYFQSYNGGWIGYDGWEAAAGAWRHVALSYDGATARLYIDNIEVASAAFTFGADDDADITIGMVQANGGGAFNGLIDEVAIWSRDISPAEVAQLYNNGAGLSLSGNTWRPQLSSPADKAVDIGMEGVVLQWAAPAESPPTPITQYDVYLSTDRAEVAEPNELDSPAFLVSVDPAGALETATGELVNNKTYYWKVVAYTDDANSATSPIWSFDTVNMTPTIVTQPQDIGVGPGGWDASFSLAATSPADGPTYAWYKEGSGELLGTEPTLLITGVDDTKAGGYYCVVSNSFGETVSDVAYLSLMNYDPDGGLRSGLWAYYPLDGNTDDQSGNGRHGTLVGSAPYVDGVLGQAIQFNGSSHVNLDRWNPSEGTGQLSFAMWLTWDGGGGDWQGPIGKRDAWGNGGADMMWIMEANKVAVYGEMQFMRDGSYPGLIQVMSDDETLVHVAVTFDGTTAVMYIDGEETRRGGFSFGADTEAGLVLGATQVGGGNAWSGMIDEVGIWNRPLTAAEVRQLYGGGTGATLPGDAWWQPVGPNPDSSTIVDPEVDLTLGWQYGPYPPKTADYEVYFAAGTAAHDVLSDPNSDASAYYKGTVAAGQPLEFVIAAADPALDYNKTCWWRIDTVDGDTRVAGVAWSFDTIKTLPDILTQPAGVLVEPGGSAELSIEVSSLIPETYEWFKEGGGSVGTGNPIMIADIDESKEGSYYAVVTNAAGSVTSDSCKVMLKQLVAHYTMDDILTTGDRQVLDATKFARHGIASAGVSSVPGLIGGALSFSTGWVDCGTFNQSDPGGQMTVAFWANWGGSNGSWQAIVSKRDDYGYDTMMWDITNHAQNGDSLAFSAPESWVGFGSNDYLAIGEWTHVAVTFDGADAILYVNGFQAGGPSAFSFSAGTGAHVYLGAAQAPGYDPFNGAIDDVRIYNYALDPVSAVKLYTDVTGGPGCPYPLMYDLSGDCEVNLADFAMIASAWMECGLIPETACE